MTGSNLHIIKAVCDRSIANIILNGEKSESISSKIKDMTVHYYQSPSIQCSRLSQNYNATARSMRDSNRKEVVKQFL
jgi:hypothetical protein